MSSADAPHTDRGAVSKLSEFSKVTTNYFDNTSFVHITTRLYESKIKFNIRVKVMEQRVISQSDEGNAGNQRGLHCKIVKIVLAIMKVTSAPLKTDIEMALLLVG